MQKSEKIFSEVRFSGQISVIEDIGKVIRLFFPSEMPHWQIENNSVIRLFNHSEIKKATEVILIDHSKFVYSSENNPTKNYFLDKLLKYYKTFEKFVESPEVLRIGLRSITLFEQANKQITIDKYKNIFSQEFIDSFGKKPVDYYDIIQFESQRIVFGPLAKSEKNPYLDEFNNKDKFTNDMEMFDVDCFRPKILKNNVTKTLKEIYTENRTAVSILENKFKDE